MTGEELSGRVWYSYEHICGEQSKTVREAVYHAMECSHTLRVSDLSHAEPYSMPRSSDFAVVSHPERRSAPRWTASAGSLAPRTSQRVLDAWELLAAIRAVEVVLV